MKRLLYFALAAICATVFASCSEKDTYEPIEFSATLSPTNTYRVGEAVEFNITGNANYVTFWNGEGRHEYKFRDRTSVALEDIEACQLEVSMIRRYGLPGGLRFFVSNTAKGFNGKNRDADLAYVQAIEASNFEGWDEITYTEPENPGSTLTTPKLVATVDIKEYADNFALLVWGKPTMNGTSNQSDFNINLNAKVQIKGHPEQVITPSTELGMIGFSPIESRINNPYATASSNSDATKGYIWYKTDPHIILIGQNSAVQVQCENWLCTTPQPLNIVTPDKGTNIKGYADILRTFRHTYNEPGQYTVTFVARTGNYIGQSETIQSLTFNIIEPVE